jgi:hypothetical protein
MQRLSRITLIFAILFTVLIVSPGLLSNQFSPYMLIKTGDVLDVFTPLILLPLYWFMLQLSPGQLPKRSEMVAFMVLAAAWASGQGMHLSANSIGHLLQDSMVADINDLTYFYDETLSHLIWHLGIIGLSALLVYRQWKNPFSGETAGLAPVIIGGVLYGFTYFLTIVEGGTGLLGVPFALLITLFVLIWARDRLKEMPLVTFFFTAYLLATILFAIWAIYWGGLPEFSDVGLI